MMVANVIGFLCPLLFILTYVFLSFLKLCSFGSAATHLPGCFCPWTFSLNIVLNKLPLNPFVMLRFSTSVIYRGFRLCNWLSLWCLVPWINHLPPTCSVLFGNLVWNDGRFVRLTWWRITVSCFYYVCKCVFKHFSMSHNIIKHFYLPYLHVSNNAFFCKVLWYSPFTKTHSWRFLSRQLNQLISYCTCPGGPIK